MSEAFSEADQKPIRLSMLLTGVAANRLERIKQETEASTNTDVIKQALKYYELHLANNSETFGLALRTK